MRQLKKILSALLAIAVTISVFYMLPGNSNTVNAATYYDYKDLNKNYTAGTDYISYFGIDTSNARYNDHSSSYNAYDLIMKALSTKGQAGYCLGFVKTVHQSCFGYSSTACCAKKYADKRTLNKDLSTMPIGASVMFSGGKTTCSTCNQAAGHIGIYIGNDSSGNQLIVHVYSGAVQVTKISTVKSHGYKVLGWCWHGGHSLSFNPPNGTPSNTWINSSCGSSITTGTSVTLNWGANNTESYWLHIWKDGADYVNESQYSRTSWTHTFTQTGSYTCYITPYGNSNFGSREGPNASVSFTVVEPTALFDVNFRINGSDIVNIGDIGNVEVYVGGSLIGSGGDFCQYVTTGRSFEVRCSITSPDYVLSSPGTVTGTTISTGNTVWFDIVTAYEAPTFSNLRITESGKDYVILEGSVASSGRGYDSIFVKKGDSTYDLVMNGTDFTCRVPMSYGETALDIYCLSRGNYEYITSFDHTFIPPAPVINTQPANYADKAGKTAKFTVEAEGTELTYQWQVFKNGTWKNTSLPGNTTDTLTVAIDASRNGMQFRCIVTDVAGQTVESTPATLTVLAVKITSQPADCVKAAGETATFTVNATGENLTYQWQVFKDGAWKNTSLTGYNTATLSVGVTAARDGMQFRCLIKNAEGKYAISNTATLNVSSFAIKTQPQDYSGFACETATFKVEAEGEGLTYQWQVFKDGAWKNTSLAGYNTDTLEVQLIASRNGMQFRCVVKDANGSKLYSNTATLSLAPLAIISQPEDFEGSVGEKATFKVDAEGEGLTYQWQVYKSGAWKNTSLSGYNTDTLEVEITEARDGMQFRCVVKDSLGNKEITDVAAISIAPITIVEQPEDYEGPAGEYALFTVEAEGEGLTYQWQVFKNDAWKNTTLTGNNSDTLKVEILTSRDGMQFRCIVKDANGNQEITETATLSVMPFSITSEPEDYEGPVGEIATFKVETDGEDLKYQWQVYKNEAWKNTSMTGNNTDTLEVEITEARDGMKFRCVITADGYTVVSDEVAIIVKPVTIVITSQPKDFTGAIGETANFEVDAIGEGLTYQWQVYKNGVWKNTSLLGNDGASLLVDAIASRNGMQFRCVITDAEGCEITTDAVTMTII